MKTYTCLSGGKQEQLQKVGLQVNVRWKMAIDIEKSGNIKFTIWKESDPSESKIIS